MYPAAFRPLTDRWIGTSPPGKAGVDNSWMDFSLIFE